MKIVVQRSLKSSVSVNEEIVSSIEKGLVLLVCMEKGDLDSVLTKACEKILNLRIFPDESDRMNLNILQYAGEILCISQFTLSWSGKKGNRPSFDNSMEPERANQLFEKFCDLLALKVGVQKGVFGQKMSVSIINDGPVTFHLEF
ncbi:D-tyrosyl-tRNA(Tyr) deacylase [Halobacteriovorax marinus]|uniref:D-aminoacyl-tRNA deacylase n=1 Tax=Halobacteriovorax marinus TaxID=97084 RepID=A0A1Y5FCH5_9BACT|nr:D-tyrosyl-tRNA(Tyr) deacylase [Halobacteriovorax marinus]